MTLQVAVRMWQSFSIKYDTQEETCLNETYIILLSIYLPKITNKWLFNLHSCDGRSRVFRRHNGRYAACIMQDILPSVMGPLWFGVVYHSMLAQSYTSSTQGPYPSNDILRTYLNPSHYHFTPTSVKPSS